MDERTVGGLRDGLLAVVALGSLLRGLRRRGELRTLRSPVAGGTGVLGALAIEVVMLRHPERTRAVWERPPVQVMGVLGIIALGRSLMRGRSPRGVAALCWGLVTYLLLLGFVLGGRENPLSGLSAWENET